MIGELRNQHMGQQPRSGKAALDRTRWRRRFNHALATAAGELRPHVANDLEAVGDVLQLLGDIFAELAQLAAAIGTAVAVEKRGVTTSRGRCSGSGLRPDLVFGSLAGVTRSTAASISACVVSSSSR